MGVDDLEVTSRCDGDLGILVVGGEVRMEIAPRLREAGEALLEQGTRHLIVNLERVDFMDSASLSALIRLDSLASEDGGTVALCHVRPAVDLVLENSGLDRRFPVFADEQAAREALAAK